MAAASRRATRRGVARTWTPALPRASAVSAGATVISIAPTRPGAISIAGGSFPGRGRVSGRAGCDRGAGQGPVIGIELTPGGRRPLPAPTPGGSASRSRTSGHVAGPAGPALPSEVAPRHLLVSSEVGGRAGETHAARLHHV